MQRRCIAALALVGAVLVAGLWLLLNRERAGQSAGRSEHARVAQPDLDGMVRFMPRGWSVMGTEQMKLGTIYLPFLHRQFVGNTALVASVEGGAVCFKGAKLAYTNRQLTHGKVTLLAGTSQLLRIELFGKDEKEKFPGQRPLQEAEQYYRSTGERYEALTDKPPSVCFQDILDKVYGRRKNEVEKAKRVEAAYIVNSRGETRKRAPVWIVTFFGCPPYPPRGLSAELPDSPEWRAARTYLRYLLDAQGNVFAADNQP